MYPAAKDVPCITKDRSQGYLGFPRSCMRYLAIAIN